MLLNRILEVRKEIEAKRRVLNTLVISPEDYSSRSILNISQQLDNLIFEYLKLKKTIE